MITISNKYRATFKVLLLGDGATGKTSTVRRYVHNKFDASYLMTIGMEPYTRYETVKGVSICYSLWDIAGQKKFEGMRKVFFKGANASLVVFDLTRKETFDNVNIWVEESRSEASDQVILLIGNKNDLVDRREVSQEEGEAKAKEVGAEGYVETSALTGENIEDAFVFLAEKLLDKSRSGIAPD